MHVQSGLFIWSHMSCTHMQSVSAKLAALGDVSSFQKSSAWSDNKTHFVSLLRYVTHIQAEFF